MIDTDDSSGYLVQREINMLLYRKGGNAMSKYGKIILRVIFVIIIGGLLALIGRAIYNLWKGIRGA